MTTFQTTLIVGLAAALCSCMASTPGLQVADSGMSMGLKNPATFIGAVAISPDGTHVLTGDEWDAATLWDIKSGNMVRSIHEPAREGVSVAFSPDGRYAATGGNNGLSLREPSTGKRIRTMGGHVTSIYFSEDGRLALTGGIGWWPRARLWDVATGAKVREFVKRTGANDGVAISPDKKYALVSNRYDQMSLFDAVTGEFRQTFDIGPNSATGAAIVISPDGRYALSTGPNGKAILWSTPALMQLATLPADPEGVHALAFSPDSRLALTGGWNGYIRVWDIATKSEIKTIKACFSREPKPGLFGVIGVTSIAMSRDGKYLVSGGSDGATRIWDFSTGKEIATLISFTNGEWIAMTPEGYYNSSPDGARQLSVQVGDKAYGQDKFYDVFYRPDIVAAKLAGKDIKDLVTLTMDDVKKTPPPNVEIIPVAKKSAEPKVKVCYQIKSSGAGIGEVRLFHNGKLIQSDGYYRDIAKSSTKQPALVAMDGQAVYASLRDISVTRKTDVAPAVTKSKGELVQDCKEVDAIPGENEVSVAAFNANNTVQSLMQTVNFNSTLKPEDPHLYILSIGINHYKDSSVNLKYAAKDATDIEDKLLKQSATLYKPENIHHELLTDAKAGKAAILAKIDELSRQVKPNDGFILFVAGHGVLLQNQYYLLTHDYDGNVSDESMLSSNDIVDLSKKIKSLSQLIIFDTCHAGGVDSIVSGLYDARMSVLAKKMGLHIYASANSLEAARDGYEGNGLFTHTLLAGLDNKKEADTNNDKAVSLAELGSYAKQATVEIAAKVGHNQTPLIIDFGKDSPVYNLR